MFKGGIGRLVAVTIRIEIPTWLERLVVPLVLLYRRLRFGHAFRRIPLTQGLYALVDPGDYAELSRYRWHANRGRDTFYAQRKSYPVRLSCDIHPWMSAWIFVFEHPYYAVTDEKGRFRIENVAAGEYQLVVQQPDVGYLHRIDVSVESGKLSKQAINFTRAELKMFRAAQNRD